MLKNDLKKQLQGSEAAHRAWDHALPYVIELLQADSLEFAKAHADNHEEVGRYVAHTARITTLLDKFIPELKKPGETPPTIADRRLRNSYLRT